MNSLISPCIYPLDLNPVTELLFIDSKVTDYQDLIDHLKPGITPVVLHPQEDGILQISEYLSQAKNISAIHLVCHGDSGQLKLGNIVLTSSNLTYYQNELKNWSNSLSSNAEFLIYSCEVAKGQQGKQFIQALSYLTQTQIAASDQKLGQGNWNFTIKTGNIQTELAFQSDILATYSGILAFSITSNNNAQDLLNTLLGNTNGLSNFSLNITGDPSAVGLFQDDPFGMGSGIVLSTGNVIEIPGENTSSTFADLTTDLGEFGVEGDIITLEIQFDADADADQVFFQYVFGSEEFLEFGGDIFNDSFELLLNGTNLAKLTNGQTVTINNLVPNGDDPSSFNPDYIDNPAGLGTLTKLDGYTQVLTFSGPLIPNSRNTLTIQLQDVSDGVLDSSVFLKSGALGTDLPPDETPAIAFSQPNYQINENGTLIGSDITINRTGNLSQPATVDVSLTDGTATAGIDYTNNPLTVNFAADQSTITIQVPILEDNNSEPTETVNLSLANPSNGFQLGSQSTAVLEILDPNNTLPFANLNLDTSSLAETGNLTVSASLSAATSRDVTLNLGFLGTATKGNDYNVSSESIFIPAGSTSGSLTITAIDDSLLEENETIIVDLSSLTNATTFGIQQTTFQLIDNDSSSPQTTPEPTPQPTPEPTPEPTPQPTPELDQTLTLGIETDCSCNSLEPPSLDGIIPNTVEDIQNGTTNNDEIQGDDRKNALFGGIGSDEVYGKLGDDNIYGDEGIQTASGNPTETDILFGNEGRDYISGSEGSDKLYGGEEDDAIFAGKNNDLVYGDLGNDTILGDLGDDTLLGDTTEPNLQKPAGQDVLFGGEGTDQLFGNGNNDTLSGGLKSDRINGGRDQDLLFGEEGADELYGDIGKDTLCGGEANDTLYGGTGSKIPVNLGSDDDELCGGNSDDILSGNEGNDTLHGEAGNDTLYGGEQEDTLLGGEGSDRLFGDLGNDILIGGAGNNTLTGGKGEDLFLISQQSGQQIITDFTQGQDQLALADGLILDQITFIQNEGTLQLQVNNRILAVLNGTPQVTEQDFILVQS